jgi:hypothetical protein
MLKLNLVTFIKINYRRRNYYAALDISVLLNFTASLIYEDGGVLRCGGTKSGRSSPTFRGT